MIDNIETFRSEGGKTMLDELETKYGFANEMSQLSDNELVDRLNAQVGNRGWGNARSYFLCCLRSELQRRDFDSGCVVDDDGIRLNRRVRLINNRLHPVD